MKPQDLEALKESLVPPYGKCVALRDAGFPQETLLRRDPEYGVWHTGSFGSIEPDDVVAAPTFEEIWRLLPHEVEVGEPPYAHVCDKWLSGNVVGYFDFAAPGGGSWWECVAVWKQGLAAAAADIWLWCKRNGHLDEGETA